MYGFAKRCMASSQVIYGFAKRCIAALPQSDVCCGKRGDQRRVADPPAQARISCTCFNTGGASPAPTAYGRPISINPDFVHMLQHWTGEAQGQSENKRYSPAN